MLKDRYTVRPLPGLTKTAIAVGLLLLCSLSTFAWDYDSQETTSATVAQLRFGAVFNKKWNNGLRLGVREDLWFDVYNTEVGPHFRKSYTTLDLGYKPIEYVKFDLGYTLKLLGPDSTWSDTKKADVNKWLRHRVFFSVTGSYTFDYAKIYLRERVQLDMRTDSVNLLERNKYDWCLRSKVGTEFIVPGKPVKPYLWVELVNTLNAPEYQQKNGHQFISSVRTQAGVKWRVSRLSSLDFFYRFTYGYSRDINITKKKGYIELTEEKQYLHSIGVTYNLDW
jgi:hypothetical protein